MRHEAHELRVGGIRLFWQSWQPDTAPRAFVVLIPGQGDHGGRYGHLGVALTRAGYSLGAIDVRGNRRSDGRRGDAPSYDALLDDVEAGIREARRIEPHRMLFLLGHSMGGQLAVNDVVRRSPPVGGVILSSPWFRLAIQLPRWKVAMGRVLARIWPTYTYTNMLTSAQLSRDLAFRAASDPDHLAHGFITARLAAALIDGGRDALAAAPRFALPLLLLQAGQDSVVDPAAAVEFARRVGTPDCTFRVYADSLHELLHDTMREQVIADIIDWLTARA